MTTPEEELKKQEAQKAHQESGPHELGLGFLGQLVDNAGKALSDAKNIAIDQASGTHSGDKVLSSISPALAAQYQRGKALEEQMQQKSLAGKLSPEQKKDIEAYHQVKKSISQVPLYDRDSLTRYVEKGIQEKAGKERHVEKPLSEKLPAEKHSVEKPPTEKPPTEKPPAVKPLVEKHSVEKTTTSSAPERSTARQVDEKSASVKTTNSQPPESTKLPISSKELPAQQAFASRATGKVEPADENATQQKFATRKGDAAVSLPSPHHPDSTGAKPAENATVRAFSQGLDPQLRQTVKSQADVESLKSSSPPSSTSNSYSSFSRSVDVNKYVAPDTTQDTQKSLFDKRTSSDPNSPGELARRAFEGRSSSDNKQYVDAKVDAEKKETPESKSAFAVEKLKTPINDLTVETTGASNLKVESTRKTLVEVRQNLDISVIEHIATERFPHGVRWQSHLESNPKTETKRPTDVIPTKNSVGVVAPIRMPADTNSTRQTRPTAESPSGVIGKRGILPSSDASGSRAPNRISPGHTPLSTVHSSADKQVVARELPIYIFKNRVEQRYITGAEIALAAIFAAAGAKRIRYEAGETKEVNSGTATSIVRALNSFLLPNTIAENKLPGDANYANHVNAHAFTRLSDVQTFSTSAITNKRFLTGAEILLASILATSGVSKIRQHFIDVKVDAFPSSDVVSQTQDDDAFSDTSNRSQKVSPNTPSTLRRMSVLIGLDDTFTTISEEKFETKSLAWLIADLNVHKARESYVDGKRVIEIQSRTAIELPSASDISKFIRERPPHAVPENLITIVLETQVDQELLNSELGLFVEDKKVKPAQDLL